MDYKARYQALVNFLLPYQEIWRNEIMLQYPLHLQGYNQDWISELKGYLTPEKALPLYLGTGAHKLSASLCAFYQELAELTQFPPVADLPTFPTRPQSWVRIIPKKRHEISRLAPLIAGLAQGRRILDIGGGQGHLAQSLAHHYDLAVTTLDMDPELQKSGAETQAHKWGDASPVKFRLHTIKRNDAAFAAMLTTSTLTSGLHTCGSLAVAHLEAAMQAGAAVVNVACCYHKTELTDLNLSRVALGHPISWNQFSLTLASGPHTRVDLRDVTFRLQLKRYRNALHVLLYEEMGIKNRVTLGNSSQELYHGPFSVYVRQQLDRLKLTTSLSDAHLETFYQSSKVQTIIEEMLAATILRDALGRALEAVILLDRALWMEEKNYAVEVAEVFDPTLSPRNLVITGQPRR